MERLGRWERTGHCVKETAPGEKEAPAGEKAPREEEGLG
jgi:hypothetical protein